MFVKHILFYISAVTMVQRLTFRRRLSYNTKSNQRRMWVFIAIITVFICVKVLIEFYFLRIPLILWILVYILKLIEKNITSNSSDPSSWRLTQNKIKHVTKICTLSLFNKFYFWSLPIAVALNRMSHPMFTNHDFWRW